MKGQDLYIPIHIRDGDVRLRTKLITISDRNMHRVECSRGACFYH